MEALKLMFVIILVIYKQFKVGYGGLSFQLCVNFGNYRIVGYLDDFGNSRRLILMGHFRHLGNLGQLKRRDI